MNNERKDQPSACLLDEPLANRKSMKWAVSLVLLGAAAGAVSGMSRIDDARTLGIVVIVLVAMVGLILLIVWAEYALFLRRMRLRMDESRVWTHIPLTKDRSLEWGQIRTAAVVHLKNMNYPEMIVLSVHEPEEALTRRRMMWKNPKRGEELRFVASDTRREMVGRMLHMELPDITL